MNRSRHVRAVFGMGLAVVAGLGSATSVSATGISSSALVCVGSDPASVIDLTYETGGFGNKDSTNWAYAICPLEVDHTIGANAQFDISVQDAHSSRGFLCTGYVLDADGDVIAETPDITTGTTETGTRLTKTQEVTVNSVATNSYVLGCNVPDADLGGSIIWTVRVD